MQVSLGLTGPLRIRANAAARWQRVHAALVAPDTEHQLDGQGTRLALLYLDPESTEGRAVSSLVGDTGLAPLPRHALAACRRAVRSGDLRCPDRAAQAVATILAALSPTACVPRPLDARIERAIASLATLGEERQSARLLAERASLSVSRFSHLFREHTGLPLRRYVLWTRLQHAVSEIAAGHPFTDAALAAGFADAAHLSRTFRRMFGIAPSELATHAALITSEA